MNPKIAGALTFGAITIIDETMQTSVPNTERIVGSREEFLRLNQGFHAPAEKYFVIQ